MNSSTEHPTVCANLTAFSKFSSFKTTVLRHSSTAFSNFMLFLAFFSFSVKVTVISHFFNYAALFFSPASRRSIITSSSRFFSPFGFFSVIDNILRSWWSFSGRRTLTHLSFVLSILFTYCFTLIEIFCYFCNYQKGNVYENN